jgi:hypothetical protein
MYRLKNYILFICIGILFFGCKKYPENKLWFKKPKDVFKGGKITMYTMNGLDQMPYYRNLYNTFPYNYFGRSIGDVFELPFEYNSGEEDFDSEYGEGNFRFSETGREVEIGFTPVNENYGAKNIFIARLSWKVLKLTKSGQLKIRADYNFKVYELQFN